ncbi:hypothetical protein MTP99_006560 [Tenebrio molitor]|jgi:hypothetical protein|nr:hypothetical protein MTP99_006560 [Tenebrio molitor]
MNFEENEEKVTKIEPRRSLALVGIAPAARGAAGEEIPRVFRMVRRKACGEEREKKEEGEEAGKKLQVKISCLTGFVEFS